MDTTVLDLLKRSAAIPSLPQVAIRFLEIVQDPEFDYREVVEVLSTDPGTVSDILRLANSPLFGVTRQITTLSQALTLLGLKRVRSLVLGRYIVESIDKKSLPGIDTSYYWRRSMATAVLASRFTDILEPKYREEAFVAGLLADVGVVILDETLSKQYRPVAEQYRPHGGADLAVLELSLFDITHGRASALVLEHWQLPEVVCEAVRWHPWNTPESQHLPLARIVGAADRMGKYLCESPDDLDEVVEVYQSVMEVLNLEPSVLAGVLSEIESQIQDFADMLHIDVIPSNVYSLIAERLREKFVEATPAANV